MTKKWFLLLIMVLALAVFALGCAPAGDDPAPAGDDPAPAGDDPAPAPEGGVLKIGVLVPTTGPEAYYGKDMMNSYELAIDEINAAGGVLGYTFELVQEDDACDAAQAATAASKIISADPAFVVGGYCSGATIPALQQFYDANLIMLVSAANSTAITDLGLNQTFMINSPATHQVAQFVELAEHLGVSKIAVIHQGDDYTQNLYETANEVIAERDDMEIVTVQVMEKGAADVSAIVTAIRQAGADFVFWCGYHADGSNVVKQLRQGGYTGEIVCGDGSSSTELITGCGEAGEGVYVLSPPYVQFVENGAEYAATFQEKYNTAPGTYSTLCYDTIKILAEAIKTANSIETEAVREAIQNIDYNGLAGRTQFTEDRERLESNFIVLQIDTSVDEGVYQLVEL